MEGVFAFFPESSFLGVFLFGEQRVGPRVHWLSALMVCVGSWLSGFFIVATNAWMQHPVGYSHRAATARVQLTSLWAPAHEPVAALAVPAHMSGAADHRRVRHGGVGAFYLLAGPPRTSSRRICPARRRVGGAIFCVLQIFPTGDLHGENVTRYQPPKFAAMEGLFETRGRARRSRSSACPTRRAAN